MTNPESIDSLQFSKWMFGVDKEYQLQVSINASHIGYAKEMTKLILTKVHLVHFYLSMKHVQYIPSDNLAVSYESTKTYLADHLTDLVHSHSSADCVEHRWEEKIYGLWIR